MSVVLGYAGPAEPWLAHIRAHWALLHSILLDHVTLMLRSAEADTMAGICGIVGIRRALPVEELGDRRRGAIDGALASRWRRLRRAMRKCQSEPMWRLTTQAED